MPRSTSSSKPDAVDTSTLKIFIGGKSKVKTGCLTCKKRHMKCDETKPACTKCTSTGRICDGYVPPPKNRRRKVVHDAPKPKTTSRSPTLSPDSITDQVLPQLSLLPDCTRQELRSIDHFTKVTTKHLTPWYKANFWDQHVLKVIYSESSVRHAIIAISVIQEHMSYICAGIVDDSRLEQTVTQSRKRFGLHNYNRSVGLLAQSIGDRGHAAEEIALINCIIFVVFNCMCGDVKTALAHLDSGGKVLDRWKDGQAGNTESQGDLKKDLSTVFLALGLESTGEKARRSRDRVPFTSLEAAEEELKTVTEEINMRTPRHRQNFQDEVKIHDVEQNKDIANNEEKHHQRLKQWTFKFEGLVDSERQNFTAAQEEEMHCLRFKHLSTLSLLWASSSPETTDPFEILCCLVEASEVLRKGSWKDRNNSENDALALCDSRTWPGRSVQAGHRASTGSRKKALMLLTKITVIS
ncbi:hypothetical protein B0J14DRAFT_583376 [Halenospora varia]|nr:hypothetical protein B0J14DRAFT_583376 [Halenospora varia]